LVRAQGEGEAGTGADYMAGSGTAPDVIANQVFIGCPWRTVRAKYERAIDSLSKKYPLSFIIVGRDDRQDAEDLLKIIKERLLSSSYAVFDATGGNPNVSLEFGIAETNEIPRVLYLSSHAAATRASRDSAIIADLAGKRRQQYTQEPMLRSLLSAFCRDHAYSKRFETFLQRTFRRKNKGDKKRARALALKVLHALDGQPSLRRADLVQRLLANYSNYKQREIDEMLSQLNRAGLIRIEPGRYSSVSVR
jgi:hypothetical protein